MKKTIAIPFKLQKAYLTDSERQELAKYGDQLMTAEEVAEHEAAQEKSAKAMLEAQKKAERDNILSKLAEIDAKSIRALREGNKDMLAEHEANAEKLRQQLQEV